MKAYNCFFFQILFRDPNSVATLESFSQSVDWAVKGEYTQQHIDEAKLSVFSDVSSMPGKMSLSLSKVQRKFAKSSLLLTRFTF